MTSVHHLELDVLDDPAVLLRVVSVCHQRRLRIASLHYDRCTGSARVLLGVDTGLMQLHRLELWLARLVDVLAVRVPVDGEQRVDGWQRAELSGEQTPLFIAPPLVVSDHELGQIFDALHHGLELADAELVATSE